jgi:chemotaxis protein methyltransferase CheR
MKRGISDPTLSRFSEFIARAMGLHFPPLRWADLARGLDAAAADLGFDSAEAAALELMAQPPTQRQSDALADHLTVGETYFFREPATFEALANHVLPELIRVRREGEKRLRIWSAACCTGEEPYSIAMALHETIPDLQDWDVTVLATDICPRFLQKAEQGVFGPWSFRGAPTRMKDRYFRPAGNAQFAILPEIRRLVRFAPLNLADDVYPSPANHTDAMDVIFCRNVLMYFTAEQAGKVIEKLHRVQRPGGWLFVSASELGQVAFPSYATVKYPNAIVYRKQESAPAAVGIPRPVPPPPPRRPVVPRMPAAPKVLPDAETDDRMARKLANEGNLSEALACCARWIARDALCAPARYLRAVVLQEQGAIEDAIGSLRAALYLEPDFVMAHFALGTLMRRRGRHRDSARHFQTALALAARYSDDEVLPESDGITAARFAQMVDALQHEEAVA